MGFVNHKIGFIVLFPSTVNDESSLTTEARFRTEQGITKVQLITSFWFTRSLKLRKHDDIAQRMRV